MRRHVYPFVFLSIVGLFNPAAIARSDEGPTSLAPAAPASGVQQQQDIAPPSPSSEAVTPPPSPAPSTLPVPPAVSGRRMAPISLPAGNYDVYMVVLSIDHFLKNAPQDKPNHVPFVMGGIIAGNDALKMLFAVKLRQGDYTNRFNCFNKWLIPKANNAQAQGALKRLQGGENPKAVFSDPKTGSSQRMRVALIRGDDTEKFFALKKGEWLLTQEADGQWALVSASSNVDCLLKNADPFFEQEKDNLERELNAFAAVSSMQMANRFLGPDLSYNPPQFSKYVMESVRRTKRMGSSRPSPVLYYRLNGTTAKDMPAELVPAFSRDIVKDISSHINEASDQIYSYNDPYYGTCWYQIVPRKLLQRGPGPVIPQSQDQQTK